MKRRSTCPDHYPLYDLNQPRLRELVRVHAIPTDGSERFDLLLTRVPGLCECLAKDEKTYRVVGVQHEPVDEDGRGRIGWHALLDVVLEPEPEAPPRKRKAAKRTRRSKSHVRPDKRS